MNTSSDSANETAVRAALAAWLGAFNSKDAETFRTLYDPAVVYANAQAPLREGIDDVVTSFASAFEQPGVQLRVHEEALFASADMALISGVYHFDTLRDDGSLEPGASGRVALLYRRAADGRWLLAFSPPDATKYR